MSLEKSRQLVCGKDSLRGLKKKIWPRFADQTTFLATASNRRGGSLTFKSSRGR